MMSVRNIVMRISFIILIVEIIIMQLLDVLPLRLSTFEETIFDAILLVVLSAPIIFYFVIKPFIDLRDEAARKVTYLAYYDSLTSLPNRARLFEWLDHSIQNKENVNVVILVLEINNLKKMHDAFGQNAVDFILVELSQKLKTIVAYKDNLAKIERNQFAFLFDTLSSDDDIYVTAKRILRVVGEGTHYDDRKIKLEGSIGISRYPDDAHSKEEMLDFANTALNKAKGFEHERISFYTQALTEAVHAAFSLEDDLRSAIEENQFYLMYQPKMDAKTQKIVGAEALIRWKHPHKGEISPVEFIPLAEDNGMIVPIGEWVLYEVINTIKKIIDAGKEPIKISINLSGRQVNMHAMQKILEVLKNTSIPKKYLDFEITETYLMKDVSQSQVLLAQLHDTGVSISMDDFGSGYSSLGYLKKFKVDVIKIDKVLIQDIEDDLNDYVIVKAIVAMSHTLGLQIVAEGVETKKQVEMLDALGCDYYQGFYFSKPLEREAIFGENF